MILERIENLRVRLGLTKAEVYEKLQISQPMISMLRAGKRQLSVKAMRRLEAAEVEAGLASPSPGRRSHDRRGNQGEYDQNVLHDHHTDYPAKSIPAPEILTPEQFQSLETRLAVLERGMSEALKLLREMSKATKEG